MKWYGVSFKAATWKEATEASRNLIVKGVKRSLGAIPGTRVLE
jgi:hypothetical protein